MTLRSLELGRVVSLGVSGSCSPCPSWHRVLHIPSPCGLLAPSVVQPGLPYWLETGLKGKKVEASALMWAQQSQNITAAPGAGRPARTGAEVSSHHTTGRSGGREVACLETSLGGFAAFDMEMPRIRHWGWWEVERWQVLSQGFRSEGQESALSPSKGGNLGPGGSRGELVQSRQTNHLAQSFAFLSWRGFLGGEVCPPVCFRA